MCTNPAVDSQLELWDVPKEAWPEEGSWADNCWALNRAGHNCRIQVLLIRKAFMVTSPPGMLSSFLVFWESDEYPIGPVQNAVPLEMRLSPLCHKGYNHSSAIDAWAHAKILAGWESDPGSICQALHWTPPAVPVKTFPHNLVKKPAQQQPFKAGPKHLPQGHWTPPPLPQPAEVDNTLRAEAEAEVSTCSSRSKSS